MVYIEILVIAACLTSIHVQALNIHKEDYLRDYTKTWSSSYLPKIKSVGKNSECGIALQQFDDAITRKGPEDFWALKMVDSWGKSNDGFYFGSTYVLGAYDQCLNTVSPDNTIRGKYCSILKWKTSEYEKQYKHSIQDPMLWRSHIDEAIQRKGQNIDQLMKDIGLHLSQGISQQMNSNGLSKEMRKIIATWNDQSINRSDRIGIIPGAAPGYLAYGTCMPDACSQLELGMSLINIFHPEESPLPIFCHEKDWNPALDEVDGMFITFCSFIAVFMLVGTAVYTYIQYTKKEHLAKGPLAILLPFAVTPNLKKLFAINPRPAQGTISCLNGMRVMSMCWVIWGHQNLFTLWAMANETDLTKRLDGFLAQILLSADFSVDTFFFLSGLLVCYGVMREMTKTGRLNIILYYVHRIIRLAPPIAMVTWYFASVHRYTVRGPIPLAYGISPMMIANGCQDYNQWWRDITFTGNIGWNNTQTWGCLGQCWYTAVDMQLYALAPIVLLPLYYFQIGGPVWMFLVTAGGLGWRLFITLNEKNWTDEEKGEVNYWMFDNYYSTWTRTDAWLIGAWTGYFIAKMGKKKLQLKQWMVLLGWILAVILGIMIQFSEYKAEDRLNEAIMIMVETFHRATWALCLAWITITCHYGYGGIVNNFLSHPSWQPFSRLTFGMYLFGQELTYSYTYTSRTLFYYTHLNKIIETSGILFFCCIYAVLLSLMIEAPILGLEKLLLKRPGRGVDTKPSGSPSHNDAVSAPVTGPEVEQLVMNKESAPVPGKTLPSGYVKDSETVGGIVNRAYEHTEKDGIPLETLLGTHNEENTAQLQQNQQVPSNSSHLASYGIVAPSKSQT